MSRIVIIILIYYRHKPIDLIYLSFCLGDDVDLLQTQT
jgi:hypothetical protein